MLKPLVICSALVASSAAGAVALSVLHDTAMMDHGARTLASVPEPSIEPRFVIPSFVPAAPKAEPVIQASLRVAPDRPDTVAPDAGPEPVVDVTPDMIVPTLRPPRTATAGTAPAAPMQKATAPKPRRQTAQVLKPRYKAKAKRRTAAAPVIVAQAPAFRASAPATNPDYLIGVYR